jgi:MSHA pilin protein MshA
VNKGTHQRGFTLIELVVVITILGILAAFAVPRFASLEGQARLAATQSLAGSIRSGAALAHAMWLANGNPASNSVTMEGQNVAMTFGYPSATAAGIQNTLVEFTGFSVSTPVAGTRRFTKTSPSGAAIPTCFVEYTAPAAANQAPTVTVTPAPPATSC